MPATENAPLLFHLVTALGAAFIGAAVAGWLRQSMVVGYLLAGLAIGPFTPGFRADTGAVEALAQVGIIFLMFTIGAQLSLRELLRSSRVVLLGSTIQVLAMIGVGFLAGRALGWGGLESLFFGAVISNSSSTVFSKILSDKGEADSDHARVGLAWSSAQDIGTIGLVAVLSTLAVTEQVPGTGLLGSILKPVLFLGGLVPLAFLVMPWLFRQAEALRNRELFTLAVACMALVMASLASLLGVSVALGAFIAGIVVGETDLSHRILGDAIPLRDIFSGIFFVSIGMLVDPAFVLARFPLVLGAAVLIIAVKGALTLGVAWGLGASLRTASLVGVGLAQSGEFSFLLARLGTSLEVVTPTVFNVMLSAAVLSVLSAPLLNRLALPLVRWLQQRASGAEARAVTQGAPQLQGHVVVCGYGRVGRVVVSFLERYQLPFVVIEQERRVVLALRERGSRALLGDATLPLLLERAQVETARLIVVCLPERMSVRQIVDLARTLNPKVEIVVRTHSEEELGHLYRHGVAEAIMGELELALEMGRRTLRTFGLGPEEAERASEDARRHLWQEADGAAARK